MQGTTSGDDGGDEDAEIAVEAEGSAEVMCQQDREAADGEGQHENLEELVNRRSGEGSGTDDEDKIQDGGDQEAAQAVEADDLTDRDELDEANGSKEHAHEVGDAEDAGGSHADDGDGDEKFAQGDSQHGAGSSELLMQEQEKGGDETAVREGNEEERSSSEVDHGDEAQDDTQEAQGNMSSAPELPDGVSTEEEEDEKSGRREEVDGADTAAPDREVDHLEREHWEEQHEHEHEHEMEVQGHDHDHDQQQ
eukprot:751017-Hanusia_phi.AAC.1